MKLEDGGWESHYPRRPGNVLDLALIVIQRSRTPSSMCLSSRAGVSSTPPSTACPRSCAGHHGPTAARHGGRGCGGVLSCCRYGCGGVCVVCLHRFNPPSKRSARHLWNLAAFISHPALDHPRPYHALLPMITLVPWIAARTTLPLLRLDACITALPSVATGILDDDAEYSQLSTGADVLVACPIALPPLSRSYTARVSPSLSHCIRTKSIPDGGPPSASDLLVLTKFHATTDLRVFSVFQALSRGATTDVCPKCGAPSKAPLAIASLRVLEPLPPNSFPDITRLLSTNDPPSDAEIPIVRQIIADVEDLIHALDTQVVHLQSTLAQPAQKRSMMKF
ncbi:hypothetical protein C8R45DRAFT_1221543 [Mycena sanguinolenta]|nr:hypothetical protein C8R45DRAFT_1221543 [Mycena sanguinolenta]